MKIKIFILISIILFLPLIAVSKESTKQISVDTIQVLKIAGQDERAVIKTPDGKMQVIKVGDMIGDRAKVIEITKGRVVIEERKDKETEKVIIRLENGKQRVERIKKAREKQPPLYAVKDADDQKSKSKESQKHGVKKAN